jgi:hypothetical protein
LALSLSVRLNTCDKTQIVLTEAEKKLLVDINQTINIFLEEKMFAQAASFLLGALKGNRHLQTSTCGLIRSSPMPY